MSFKPGEPLSHDDVVFAKEFGVSAIFAAAVTLIAMALGS